MLARRLARQNWPQDVHGRPRMEHRLRRQGQLAIHLGVLDRCMYATHKIPKSCLDLPTLAITLELLLDKLGKRFPADWVKKAVAVNGEVDFSR